MKKMSIWVICLAAFLILSGLINVIDLKFDYDKELVGILSIIAGVMVILQK